MGQMQEKGLKVLMVSGDRNILVSESAVSERMKEYGRLVEELHIVLLCDKTHGFNNAQIAQNVWVYPTNSASKFLRPIDAVQVGKNIECNLITTQDPFECGWAGMKLRKIKNVPLEVQLHTDPFSKQFSGVLNLVRKQIMKSVIESADAVRVVLKAVRDKLKDKYAVENISILPIYVDRKRIQGEAEFNLHEKYGFKQVILTVSRLTEEKNIGLALKAFKIVREKFSEVGLVIVGSGPEKFEKQDGVVFAGWQEELTSYYKTADIFLQTSKFEGYGLSLVEAGLSDLPVVSTKVGVVSDFKDGEEILVVESEAGFVAQAVSRLLLDEGLRLGLSRALKATLEANLLDKEAYLARLKTSWTKLVNH